MHLNVCDTPRAAPGETAFRVMSLHGWFKISAKNKGDAMRQALRYIAKPERMEIWNGFTFVPCL